MEKQTVFEYQYRDASNYKIYNAIRLQGVLTDSDIDTMRECMYDGEFFIPQEVGLPPLQTMLCEEFGGPNEDDHDWHTIECIRAATQDDENLPICGKTDELIAKFIEIGSKRKNR